MLTIQVYTTAMLSRPSLGLLWVVGQCGFVRRTNSYVSLSGVQTLTSARSPWNLPSCGGQVDCPPPAGGLGECFCLRRACAQLAPKNKHGKGSRALLSMGSQMPPHCRVDARIGERLWVVGQRGFVRRTKSYVSFARLTNPSMSLSGVHINT